MPENIILNASLFLSDEELETLEKKMRMPTAMRDWEDIASEADWESLCQELAGKSLHFLMDTSLRVGKEKMSLFVRFSQLLHEWETHTRFISNVPCLSGKSKHQLDQLLEHCAKLKIALTNILSLTVDSCSTNLGALTGLAVLLAEKMERLIVVVGCDLHVLQFMLANGIGASFGRAATSEDAHSIDTVYKLAYKLGKNWEQHAVRMEVFRKPCQRSSRKSTGHHRPKKSSCLLPRAGGQPWPGSPGS
jgi:hypothetical protein